MGYTHYWKIKKPFKDIEKGEKLFKQAVEATRKCIDKVPAEIPIIQYGFDWTKMQQVLLNEGKAPFKLCGGDGKGEPEFTDTLVRFNGDASCDNDHETFSISIGDSGFDFCKTARKPYDVAVCIALICFSKYFGDDFNYSSDGDISEGEEGWKMAKEITKKYFKYGTAE